MQRSPIRFLYFDMGNVLLDFDHRRGCKRVAELCNVSPELVQHVLFDTGLEWNYERGDLTSAEFHRRFTQAIPSAPSVESLMNSISDIFQAKPAIEPLLERLTQRGLRLGVLSNTCEAHWTHVHPDRFPFLAQRFQIHALSYKLGFMKPEADIYRLALEMSGTAPAETFFVDDREENVIAAQKAGIDAVHFRSVEQLEVELVARGLL